MKIPDKYICLDFETTGLDFTKDKPHGIGIGYAEDEVEYYPMWAVPSSVKKDLADPSLPKLGQNLHAFDAKFARRNGLEIRGDFHDTKILGNLVDADQPLGLKEMSDKYLGPESLDNKRRLDAYLGIHKCSHVGQLCAKDLQDPEHPHLNIIAEYCKEDVNNTIKLFHLFMNKLQAMDKTLKAKPFNFSKSPLDYYFEEAMPLEYVLFEMEYRGIRVDLNAINRIREHAVGQMVNIEKRLNHILERRIKLAEQELYSRAYNKTTVSEKAKAKLVAGVGKCQFSWGNNNHFGLLLYRFCDLPDDLIKTTHKGKYQTDKAAIKTLQEKLPSKHPLQKILVLYAEYKLHGKIASTYTGDNKKGILSKVRIDLNGIPRIHPEYRQTTGTGRLACTNPNMQNIKRDSEIKKFFIPDNPDEVFDDADYSQIELRTGAHLSQDSNLLHAYRDEIDVHLLTASRLFGREISKSDDLERQAGKRTNFLTIFDGKEYRLQQALKADTGHEFSIPECKRFIATWFQLYPEVRDYLDQQKKFFQDYKFCISETGRVRRLPEISFGKDLKWFRDEATGGWIAKYIGPRRSELIESFNKRYPNRKLTESAIGKEARGKFDHAVKAGYNQPIQGLAASMTKRAMIALHAEGRLIANQVHDSLVVSRKRGDLKAKQQVIDIMKNTYTLSIPVEVDCKTLSSFHPNDKVKE